MSQFALTEEQAAIQETALDFAKERIAPHAAEWDETSHFPVDVIRETAALGMAAIYVPAEAGRLGALAPRRRADHGGAGRRLPGDLRLHLDPQHGGVDDRRVRLATRSAARVDAQARVHGVASAATASPSPAPARMPPRSRPAPSAPATTTCSTAPSSSSPAPAPPTSISSSRAPATTAPTASRPSWSRRTRPASPSARTRRRWAGTPSRRGR